MILLILKFIASVLLSIVGLICAHDKIWGGVFFSGFLIILLYWDYLIK